MSYIHNNFASTKGLIRLLLSEIRSSIGLDSEYRKIELERVERFVFVCLGNICRSPYGEFVAKGYGVSAAGYGLATTTGVEAFPLGRETAFDRGIDMTPHRATDFSDFKLYDSDLLLVMELRHANRLKPMVSGTRAQIALLGNWATPRRLHIHDPHVHGREYFETCYSVIDSAVSNLVEEYRAVVPE